jgi:hypothetical protein
MLNDQLPCENDATYNTRGLMAPIYVTESYQQNNAIGAIREYAYAYKDAWAHIAGHRYLGFRTVRSSLSI